MKLFSRRSLSHWCCLAVLCCASLLPAQDNVPARPNEPDKSADTNPNSDAAGQTTSTADQAEVHKDSPTKLPDDQSAKHNLTQDLKEIVSHSPAAHFYHESRNPYVGVFNDVEVGEDETADVVVAVRGNYTLKGRSRTDAVAVLGDGDVTGSVGGNCVTILGGIKTDGTIDGNLVVIGSRAYIDGPVNGDVVLIMSKVEFGPNARIAGETVMVGPQPKVSPGTEFLGGMRKYNLGETFPSLIWVGDYFRDGPLYIRPIAPGVGACWWVVGFFFLFRFIVVLLFPRPIESGAGILRERALRSFVIGLIAYTLFPVLGGLLIATGIGAIAVPFIFAAFVIASILGKIALLRSVGGQIGRQLRIPGLDTPLGGFVAGSVLITAVYMVPVLGGIVFLLIKPMALGAMLIAAVDSFGRERKRPLENGTPPKLDPPVPSAGNAPRPEDKSVVAGVPIDSSAKESEAVSSHQKTQQPAPGSVALGTVASPAAATTSEKPPTERSASISAPNISGRIPPVIGAAPRRFHDVSPEEMLLMPRVGFWPRLGATLLDFALIFVVIAMLLRGNTSRVFVVAWLLYHLVMWTWRGTTLGGIVFSLRIIRLDGRAPDFIAVLVRVLASCLSLVVACLGFFWASWNPEKQSWHDLIAGTVIVRTPRSIPLI